MKKITIYPVQDTSEHNSLFKDRFGFLVEEEGQPDVVITSTWDAPSSAIGQLETYLRHHLTTTSDFTDISKHKQ